MPTHESNPHPINPRWRARKLDPARMTPLTRQQLRNEAEANATRAAETQNETGDRSLETLSVTGDELIHQADDYGEVVAAQHLAQHQQRLAREQHVLDEERLEHERLQSEYHRRPERTMHRRGDEQ